MNPSDAHCPSPQCWGDWQSCTDYNGEPLSASWVMGVDEDKNRYCWQKCGNPKHLYPNNANCYTPQGTVANPDIECISTSFDPSSPQYETGFCAYPAHGFDPNTPEPLRRMLSEGGRNHPVPHDRVLHAGINVVPEG